MEPGPGREFLNILDDVDDLLSIHDKDFTIAFVNKAFADHVGLPREEILGEKCYTIVHGSNLPIPNCPHRQTLAVGKSAREVVHDPKSGRTFSVSTFPHTAPDGTFAGSVHLARDITEEREHLLRLVVRELRAFPAAAVPSRPDQGPVGIRCVIDGILETFAVQGRLRNVTVERRSGEHDPEPLVLEVTLRQILMPLIANAIDAMADRGTLTIATTVHDTTAHVDITDTGTGIAPENIGRIFKPFFSTKGGADGTGLGLCVARVVAEEQQGNIAVLSSWEGRGTTFRVSLPC